MLLAALLAATAAAQSPQAVGGTTLQQASATVRIVPGERISAAELPRDALVRDTHVKGADGQSKTVRLVEFP